MAAYIWQHVPKSLIEPQNIGKKHYHLSWWIPQSRSGATNWKHSGLQPRSWSPLKRGLGGFLPRENLKIGLMDKWTCNCNVVWEGKERPIVMSESRGAGLLCRFMFMLRIGKCTTYTSSQNETCREINTAMCLSDVKWTGLNSLAGLLNLCKLEQH